MPSFAKVIMQSLVIYFLARSQGHTIKVMFWILSKMDLI